eukprot:TRINITY_DN52635_c0_g2_i8.p1 TRINITY_DN52635_c0_g2~~TRINITY_DN52635_c0_g2_i8.p1  ORF type:complete len:188 (-),score=41.95 TRINITY_DN52635_c0_g2_i8:9-572(-)
MKKIANEKDNLLYIQTFTMFLVCIAMFLRDDDIHDLQFMDILPEFSTIHHNGVVDSIVFRISGKGEVNKKIDVKLVLWRNRVCRKLDPISWLLYYLCHKGVNLEEGYIFPLTAGLYAKTLKKAFLETFPKEDWSFSCTHVGKRTGYLMARLGDGEHATISLAARNRTESTSRGYDRDCSTLRELYKS